MIILIMKWLSEASRALKLEYGVLYNKNDIYYVKGMDVFITPVKSLSSSGSKTINEGVNSKIRSATYRQYAPRHRCATLRHPGIGAEVILHSRILKNK